MTKNKRFYKEFVACFYFLCCRYHYFHDSRDPFVFLIYFCSKTIVKRTEIQCTSRIVHFAQSCCTFMSGRYLKAYRTTKMASGKDYFPYGDDVANADMFEEKKDMESGITTCIKTLHSRENCSFKRQFCPKVCFLNNALINNFVSKKSYLLGT